MPTVAFHTLGCKLNYAETSTLGRQFLAQGYSAVEFGTRADVCVINTCSVTARANTECRQIIRRALRTSPNALVVVTGCYAQLAPEEVASIHGVDLVLGTREKASAIEHILAAPGKYATPRILVSEISDVDNFGPAFSTEGGERTRAFLKVQDGCDYSCSFCTIPMARGQSRSQTLDACVEQARGLVKAGFREIVLTGVNVGDYGRKSGSTLLALLQSLVAIDGLSRIRVSSIEPNLLTPEIIELARNEEKLCKHFHIPLQSGSDTVLRQMRRRYTTGMYQDLIGNLRDRLPLCGIGVDVIVGFPGETDELFEETHRFLADLPISYLHVFTYSERPGTPAASFGGTVPHAIRSRRNEKLRVLSSMKRQAFQRILFGHQVHVLTESEVENGYRFGWTDNYVRVGVPADDVEENSVVCATIEKMAGERCLGTLVGMEER